MRLRALLTLSAMIAAGVAAHADTYQYTVQLGDHIAIFDEAKILTAYTTIYSSAMTSGTSPDIIAVDINPTSSSCAAVIGFPPDNACEDIYLFSGNSISAEFEDGPFTTPGVTYNVGPSDTLLITDIPDVVATPEPSTLALLGTGLLGVAGFARRRLISGGKLAGGFSRLKTAQL